MGHGCEVADDGVAIDVLAQGEGQFGFAVGEGRVLDEFAHRNRDFVDVGNFDADGVFTGNGREDVDAFRFGGARQIVFEGGDAVHAQPFLWINFVAGDGRSAGDVARGDVDAKCFEGADDRLLGGEQGAFICWLVQASVFHGEQIQVGQLVVGKFGAGRGRAAQAGSCRSGRHFLVAGFLADVGQSRTGIGGWSAFRGVNDFWLWFGW